MHSILVIETLRDQYNYSYILYLYSMNIQEEVDALRVRAAQDAATIHELKICLEQEREGKTSRLMKMSFYRN